ncbi:MAG: hypothetical protein ACREA9_18570 [Pyrinomonadaceae bacterium]
MKRLILTLMAATPLTLTAFIGISAAADVQTKKCESLPVSEYARYQGPLDDHWEVLVIPPKTSRECILDLIRKLHQQEPKVHFEIFDSDQELVHYVRWAKAPAREQDSLFYPNKWIAKHNLASLYSFSVGPPPQCEWTVKFRNGDDVKLDRVDCRSLR